jgi:RNA polymerase sigma-70 factor, ECF subfamily
MAEMTFIIPSQNSLGDGLKSDLARGIKAIGQIGADAATVAVETGKKATVSQYGIQPLQKAASMSDREIDQQLVLKAQSGDKRAFELLVIKYQRKVERLLSRIIRDQSEIEDVAQESFIKAYRALSSFRGDSAFYTWLYRISVNTAKNYLISQGRRAPTSTGYDAEEAENFEDAMGLRDVATPDALLMSKQIGEIVNRTIEALPEELRTAITLREIEGLSYEEIAQIMDCPIGTVRSRIFRAREAVAEQLRPQLDTNKETRW